ncbi:MAG TPA: hypothetical protein VNY35_00140 [Solirubrobacteraceae bacterium]|nr:hypothetical protein [Solirubrobacteraceae bacterium]
MSIIPQLERDLLEAASRRLSSSDDGPAESSRSHPGVRGRARRLRLPVLAFGGLLASTAIALAASGVILSGAPVRPGGSPNPIVGEGVPTPGASRLLPLRVPDPEGGPPWGMRIVSTTRGEVCVQIGRIQHAQLGELGIDGVFHDDGRFHPMSADVLPETSRIGTSLSNNDATESVSCHLAGQAVAGEHLGVGRSAGGANGHVQSIARRELRNLAYGLLGPAAVSVSYHDGNTPHTALVLAPIGAYLIVQRAAPAEQVASGQEGLGTEGDLPPSPPLTAITYRIDGKLCRRGPVEPPGTAAHLTGECPQPHFSTGQLVRTRDLHRPVHVRLQISRHVVTGAEVRFIAPFAVTGARENYTIDIPTAPCHGSLGEGFVGSRLDRNVAAGALVTSRLAYPFENACGRRSVTIEVRYSTEPGAAPVLVGRTAVREPVGARPGPPMRQVTPGPHGP